MSFSLRAHGNVRIYAWEGALMSGSLLVIIFASYLLYLFVEIPGITLGKSVVAGLRRRREIKAVETA